MAININGKTYRNLQQQVLQNMNDIAEINSNEVATKNDIPTDTSDLTNGAGFITSSDLPEGLQVYLHTYYSHYVTETTEGWAVLNYSSTSSTSMPWDSDTNLMDLNEGVGSWAIATGWYKNASNEVHMIITASVDKKNRYVWFNIEGSQSQSLAGSVWSSNNANATNGHKVDPQKFPRI